MQIEDKLEGEKLLDKASILVDRWLREGKRVFNEWEPIIYNDIGKSIKFDGWTGCFTYDVDKDLNYWDTTKDQFEKSTEEIFKLAKEGMFTQDSTKEKEGKKDNSTKLPMSILFKQFPRALQAVVLASSYGHNKYKKQDTDYLNFSRVEEGSKAYHDADIRHQLDKEIYGENDIESGLPHVFHEAFDKLAKCELWIKENNIDIKEFSKNYLEKLAQ